MGTSYRQYQIILPIHKPATASVTNLLPACLCKIFLLIINHELLKEIMREPDYDGRKLKEIYEGKKLWEKTIIREGNYYEEGKL